MFRHRSRLVQAAVALVLLTVSALLWPSLGASATSASCVPGNSVCITNSPAASTTLNGTDQTVFYKLDFALNNTNNTAGGWHVTINSTQFVTTSIATTTPTRTLSANASSVTAVTTVSACPNSPSNCPNNMIPYPVLMPAGNTVTFYNNKSNTKGIGTFNLEATIGVSVPGNAYAGTYTSTITIALITGP